MPFAVPVLVIRPIVFIPDNFNRGCSQIMSMVNIGSAGASTNRPDTINSMSTAAPIVVNSATVLSFGTSVDSSHISRYGSAVSGQLRDQVVNKTTVQFVNLVPGLPHDLEGMTEGMAQFRNGKGS